MRTKIFRVLNNRLQFLCPYCNAKRSIAVQSDLRRRRIRCLKCQVITQCILNRRTISRETQAGKCVMITNQGKEIEVDLHDISLNGLGCDLPLKAVRSVFLSQEIQFKCSWNPRLLSGSRFVVRSIKGRRIGAEKITANLT